MLSALLLPFPWTWAGPIRKQGRQVTRIGGVPEIKESCDALCHSSLCAHCFYVPQVAEGLGPSHPDDFSYCNINVQDSPGEKVENNTRYLVQLQGRN